MCVDDCGKILATILRKEKIHMIMHGRAVPLLSYLFTSALTLSEGLVNRVSSQTQQSIEH